MRYHYKLKNLPFVFNPFDVRINFDPQDTAISVETQISISETEKFNPAFIDWCRQQNIILQEGRYFESRPNALGALHRDTLDIKNKDNPYIVKFNFIFNSYGTEMCWYKTTSDDCRYVYTSDGNFPLAAYHKNKCTEIYKASADEHCMLYGGAIHRLINSENNGVNRKCYSYMMVNYSWYTAVKNFSYFLE